MVRPESGSYVLDALRQREHEMSKSRINEPRDPDIPQRRYDRRKVEPPQLTRYEQLLRFIEKLKDDILPAYAGDERCAERLMRNIALARLLIRENVAEVDSEKQKWMLGILQQATCGVIHTSSSQLETESLTKPCYESDTYRFDVDSIFSRPDILRYTVHNCFATRGRSMEYELEISPPRCYPREFLNFTIMKRTEHHDLCKVDFDILGQNENTLRFEYIRIIKGGHLMYCGAIPEKALHKFLKRETEIRIRISIYLYRYANTDDPDVTAIFIPKLPPDQNMACFMSDLFENQRTTDISFIVGGEEFKAHRAVICCRSEPLKRMLESKENEQYFIIPDVAPEVFKEILKHIYTGELNTNFDFREELLVAASRFGLEILKNVLELRIARKIKNAADAARCYAIASKINGLILKRKARAYFRRQNTFGNSRQYNQLVDMYPHMKLPRIKKKPFDRKNPRRSTRLKSMGVASAPAKIKAEILEDDDECMESDETSGESRASISSCSQSMLISPSLPSSSQAEPVIVFVDLASELDRAEEEDIYDYFRQDYEREQRRIREEEERIRRAEEAHRVAMRERNQSESESESETSDEEDGDNENRRAGVNNQHRRHRRRRRRRGNAFDMDMEDEESDEGEREIVEDSDEEIPREELDRRMAESRREANFERILLMQRTRALLNPNPIEQERDRLELERMVDAQHDEYFEMEELMKFRPPNQTAITKSKRVARRNKKRYFESPIHRAYNRRSHYFGLHYYLKRLRRRTRPTHENNSDSDEAQEPESVAKVEVLHVNREVTSETFFRDLSMRSERIIIVRDIRPPCDGSQGTKVCDGTIVARKSSAGVKHRNRRRFFKTVQRKMVVNVEKRKLTDNENGENLRSTHNSTIERYMENESEIEHDNNEEGREVDRIEEEERNEEEENDDGEENVNNEEENDDDEEENEDDEEENDDNEEETDDDVGENDDDEDEEDIAILEQDEEDEEENVHQEENEIIILEDDEEDVHFEQSSDESSVQLDHNSDNRSTSEETSESSDNSDDEDSGPPKHNHEHNLLENQRRLMNFDDSSSDEEENEEQGRRFVEEPEEEQGGEPEAEELDAEAHDVEDPNADDPEEEEEPEEEEPGAEEPEAEILVEEELEAEEPEVLEVVMGQEEEFRREEAEELRIRQEEERRRLGADQLRVLEDQEAREQRVQELIRPERGEREENRRPQGRGAPTENDDRWLQMNKDIRKFIEEERQQEKAEERRKLEEAEQARRLAAHNLQQVHLFRDIVIKQEPADDPADYSLMLGNQSNSDGVELRKKQLGLKQEASGNDNNAGHEQEDNVGNDSNQSSVSGRRGKRQFRNSTPPQLSPRQLRPRHPRHSPENDEDQSPRKRNCSGREKKR